MISQLIHISGHLHMVDALFYWITLREGKEKEDDPGDAGEIYQAGTGNNVQTMDWIILLLTECLCIDSLLNMLTAKTANMFFFNCIDPAVRQTNW